MKENQGDDKITQKKFIERELSQKIFTFRAASNAIKDKNDPLLSKGRGNISSGFNNGAARYGVTQSLRFAKKKENIKYPNVKVRQIPSSSLSDIISPHSNVKRNISFGRVPYEANNKNQNQIISSSKSQSLVRNQCIKKPIVPPQLVVPKTQTSWPNKIK